MFKGYRITSPYGNRPNPFNRSQTEFHSGIDLVKNKGGVNAPIQAFVGGEVIYSGEGKTGSGLGGYGVVVLIKDKNGHGHLYAHLSSASVKKGDNVKKGNIIGRQGATGQVTGAHLHYEIRKTTSPSYGWTANKELSTVEPTAYLKSFNQKSISEMAQEVIEGKHGNGHENRRKSLGISQSEYEQVRAEVNRRVGAAPKKSISQMADEIIAGKHGNGHENRRKSLGIDKSTYEKVRSEVNKRLR